MRKYIIGQLYFEGSLLKVPRCDAEAVIIANDVTSTEAAEIAGEYGLGVRIFTEAPRKIRRSSATGWPT